MSERRHSGRWQIESQASIKIPESAQPLDCTIEDINFKGMRIRCPLDVDMNNILSMSVILGKELSLSIGVAAVWNKLMGQDRAYGFSFTRIKDEDKEQIYKFIQTNFAQKIREQVYRGTI